MSRDVLVVCHHALSDTWPAMLAVRPGRFERQLRYLRRRGYRATTFTDAVRRPRTGRTMAVTFDDAFASVLTLAYPVMERLGIPGTVFVPTRFPGATGPMRWAGIDHWLDTEHGHELTPMDWDQLRWLADRGWEIGSHTETHPRLPALSPESLTAELERSRETIQRRIGTACTSIAYPYGAVSPAVVAATTRAGYEAAAGLRWGPPTAVDWPRVGIYRKDATWRFVAKVSKATRTARTLARR